MKAQQKNSHSNGSKLIRHQLGATLSDQYFGPIFEILALLKDVDELSGPEDILGAILEKARAITNADRAEIALWSPGDNALKIFAQRGSRGKMTGGVGAIVEKPYGMMMRVWKKKSLSPEFANVLHPGRNYARVDSRTRSEAAICLRIQKRRIGVLNLEWFEKQIWSAERQGMLGLLADQAALAINIVERNSTLRELAAGLSSNNTVSHAICRALDRLQDNHGIDRALVYLAEPSKDGKWRLNAKFALLEGKAKESATTYWTYLFSEDSLALDAYKSRKPILIPNVRQSAAPNRRGLRQFKIKGPILGLPLVHNDQPVGSLVLWTSDQSGPSEKDAYNLKPISDLIAAYLSRQHASTPALLPFDLLGELFWISQSAIDLKGAKENVLTCLRNFGFDRARIFSYHHPGRQGRVNEGGEFVRDLELALNRKPNYKKLKIPTDDSPYAKDMELHYLRNPEARIYDPTDKQGLGPDPHHKALRKRATAPWIAVPISLHGRLIGQLAADNQMTGKQFPPFALQFVTLAAGITAHVLERLSFDEASILSELPMASFSKDVDGRILTANQRYCDDVGLPLNRLRGLTDDDLFGKDLAKVYRERDLEVMTSGKRKTWIEPNISGRKSRWVQVVKGPLFDARGRAIGIQGFYLEEPFRALFQNATEGLYRSTAKGRYLDVNPALADMLGYTVRELLDPGFDIKHKLYVDPEVRDYFRKRIRRNAGAVSNFEYYLRRKDGTEIKVSEQAWEVVNPKGRLLHYEGIVRDLSEQVKASRAVMETDESQLPLFIAEQIAHEIANPIQMGSDAIIEFNDDRCSSEKVSPEMIEVLLSEVAAHNENAKEILQAYEFGEKEGMGPPAILDAVIGEVFFSLAPRLDNAGFECPTPKLNCQEREHRSTVTMPEVRVRQILTNLIKNSIEAARDNDVPTRNRKISLSTKLIESRSSNIPNKAILNYEDTCGGMPPEKQRSLFQRGGKGRGMLVVNKILDSYGGTISVQSRKGRGTTFVISIPILSDPQ